MIVRTALGKEFECDSVTFIPTPARLYLHLVGVSAEDVMAVFNEGGHLPIEGYPVFRNVQSISSEGAARVKVSLRN